MGSSGESSRPSWETNRGTALGSSILRQLLYNGEAEIGGKFGYKFAFGRV